MPAVCDLAVIPNGSKATLPEKTGLELAAYCLLKPAM